MNLAEFKCVPALAEYLDGADHVDVKSGQGALSLRECVVGILSYQPGWMQFLWKVRVWLLRLLGQGEHGVPEKGRVTAETLPIEAGQKASFFTVADSDGETYWIAVGEESHLGMALGVVAESVEGQEGVNQFHVITVVQYRNWAGSIYFNMIRPFHHLVVSAAMRSLLLPKDSLGH